MSSLSLFYSIGVPLDVVSEAVDVSEIDEGYGIGIVTAPPSELNVFDVSIGFDSAQGGVWTERDNTLFQRGLEDAGEHVYYTVRTHLDLADAEWLRVRISTGDMIVACACLLEF